MAFSNINHENQALWELPSRGFLERRQPTESNKPGTEPTKLPPRSRSGCWTCRTRKVKCDEARPKCRQCVRLNHDCDYSPKLSFKDETSKVIDKYLGSATVSPSWSALELTDLLQRRLANEPDNLPPFIHLTNDEDWQQKAIYKPPGTYYIVANSDSFADNPEYQASSNISQSSLTPGYTAGRSNANILVDQATVILGTFDDALRKSSVDSSSSFAPRSPVPLWPINLASRGINESQLIPSPSSAAFPAIEHSVNNLIFHWRSSARMQLFEIDAITTTASLEMQDFVEIEAASYEPLRHAVLALASLSLSMRQGSRPVQALEYYTQAIDALRISRSEQELLSNGLFLTHYILLVYEVAATEKFWYYHMVPLKAILIQRKFVLHTEPFANIIFSICSIDATAMMSCSGTGTLILELLLAKSIPTFPDIQQSIPILPESSAASLSLEGMEATYNLLKDLLICWASLGHAFGRIRQEIQGSERQAHAQGLSQTMIVTNPNILHWRQETRQLRESIKRTWNLRHPTALDGAPNLQLDMAGRSGQTYEHALLLYHTSMVYSHTSMWPSQTDDLLLDEHDRIEAYGAISAIIGIISDLVARGQLQQRAAVFALFLAGVFTTNHEERVMSVQLLKSFEQVALGSNTRATRVLLETVLGSKDDLRQAGLHENIDWISTARDLGWGHLLNRGW